ncbi:RICIN domain-containing protein [Chitinophaga flava]|uniref:Ricin B lectin domain-containing protein n=1 Tax=Chitinophaga flava TaxID=2259036 RepID=A0A365Y071_9BACT|nr:RICIN domain-containing protein [Chitinophaga flava]RBL92012.1 hypothetical protein DF182_05285 [Chitinophaga flava]
MKKLFFNTALLLVGLICSTISVSAQIASALEPYFTSYTRFVTSNPRDKEVLMYQYNRIVKDSSSLKTRLTSTFPGKTFSNFNFLIVGGYGTNTPVRSIGDGQASDLDLNMLFKIDNGAQATISAFTFKTQVQSWLTGLFTNTANSHYYLTMKDPVIEIKADTTFPDGTRLDYHMDLGSFNQLNNPQNPNCHPAKLCSQMAWGTTSDNAIGGATWEETESPSFVGGFNGKFPEGTTTGDRVLSVCKMLKYWNKYANKDTSQDNVPPSITYLIGAYNWIPPSTTDYRLGILIAEVDSLRRNIFNNNCSSVAGAHLDVPFYTSMDPNVLRKMSPASLTKFCDSLKKLSDTLHYVATLPSTSLNRGLAALSNVLPDFNNLAPGIYNIYSWHSKKLIYPKNGGVADGDTIVQYSYSNDSIKKWEMGNIEAAQGKFYYVAKNLKSKKVMDVFGGSYLPGTAVIQYGFGNADNQKWELVFLGYVDADNKKLYQLVCKRSGLLLDVTGASYDDNAVVEQWGDNGGNNQKWYFVEVP